MLYKCLKMAVTVFEIVPFVVLLTHTIQILRINLLHRTL